MGHGLVREDMHSGSISHLGIVVLPALLALAQYRRVSGRDFIAAAVAGYEVGGQCRTRSDGCRSGEDPPPDRHHRSGRRCGGGFALARTGHRAGDQRDRARCQYHSRIQSMGAHRRQRDVLPRRIRCAQCGERGSSRRKRGLRVAFRAGWRSRAVRRATEALGGIEGGVVPGRAGNPVRLSQAGARLQFCADRKPGSAPDCA